MKEEAIPNNHFPKNNLHLWTRSYQVSFHDVDWHNQLRLPTLLNWMQETAWQHANANELGGQLIQKKQFWALARMHFIIEKYPQWEDTIYIQTWAKSMDAVFAHRDFLLFDAKKQIIGRTTSQWLLVNIETRRPVRLQSIADQMPIYSEQSALPPITEKLGKLETREVLDEVKVRYSDLDVNQHANNVLYLKWVLDTSPKELRDQYQIKAFKINFKAECHLDQVIEIGKAASQNAGMIKELKVDGIRKEDGKEIFRADISWQEK